MAKITNRPKGEGRETIVVKTNATSSKKDVPSDWWNSASKDELSQKLLSTVGFLKEQNQFRYRQASLYSVLYGNKPLAGVSGASLAKMNNSKQLPTDRPTMSVVTSATDTIVSRLTQNRPRPIFLTENAHYKQRKLAQELNAFIGGELYQTKSYDLGVMALRDACIIGTGVLKVLEDQSKRVSVERRLCTDLLVDPNDSFYGKPRQIYEVKLVDRAVLADMFPKYAAKISKAEQAYPEASDNGVKTVSDQVMVAEGWRLASGPKAGDGLHAIVCSEGVIFDEKWEKTYFPFVTLNYSDPMIGFWGQSLVERQFGTQMGINSLLATIHKSINLVGVPRVFVEDGSKVIKSHLNNEIGAIVTYRGTKPIYEVAPCVPVELYQQLDRLVKYCYEQEGISQLTAASQKPQGLNSGEALRQYDDIQSDRFSALQKKYENVYVDLSYLIIDKARDIAKRDGKYQTVFPDKTGTKEVDLPAADLLDDPFVIQCFDMASLPKDPAGRAQRIVEFMQAGIYTQQEGRRLIGYADTEQVDKLAVAGEERVYYILDKIVDDGEYNAPDGFLPLDQAIEITTQYVNLYATSQLEEEKMSLLRQFKTQVENLKSQAAQALATQNQGQPMANPTQTPQSDLLQNVNAPMSA